MECLRTIAKEGLVLTRRPGGNASDMLAARTEAPRKRYMNHYSHDSMKPKSIDDKRRSTDRADNCPFEKSHRNFYSMLPNGD